MSQLVSSFFSVLFVVIGLECVWRRRAALRPYVRLQEAEQQLRDAFRDSLSEK